MIFVGENPSLEISLGRWAETKNLRFSRLPASSQRLHENSDELLIWATAGADSAIPENLQSLAANLQSLVCLPHGAYGLARKALDAGFKDYLCVPTSEKLLFQRLERLIRPTPAFSAVQIKADDADLSELGAEFRGSAAGRKLLESLETVAAFPTTVLFEGETGSGKEIAAQLLHRLSPRGQGPFVICHLAALSRDIVESELFGHVKGAFTGAMSAREGAFAVADGGTLFLDEISEAPLDIQVKILRAVQTKSFTPVGSDKPRTSDCRILAATNRDLLKEVREGRFRQDLYYRLSVYGVRVPPLRDRTDGMESLVLEILRRLSAKYSRPLRGISEAALDRIRAHAWPGNIRELENVLERALIHSPPGPIEPEFLLIDSQPAPAASGQAIHVTVRDEDLGENFSLDAALETFESAIIRRAMDKAGGNLAEAARLLGIPRSTLHGRLSKIPRGNGGRPTDD